ncbi:MAG: glycosyltransferase family 4 protein [Gemmatimonadota bacterium]
MPTLRTHGLQISEDGDRPARVALAADGQCAVAAFAYATRHRCPLILYIWDLPPWRLGTGRPDHIFATGGRLWKIPRLFNRYPERAGNYSRIGYVAQQATLVLAPSTTTVADVRARLGVEATQLPFCYDSGRFNGDATAAAPGGTAVLLSISRLTQMKNHSVLLRAAARIPEPVAVRIIGRGVEADSLRQEAARLGVALRLDDGWASDEEIVAAYREASVVVCPSRFEGFGLTPMEGLAMRRPVVASDIAVHREFVGPKVRLFDPDDAEALAHACREALASPATTVADEPLPQLTIGACADRIEAALRPFLA